MDLYELFAELPEGEKMIFSGMNREDGVRALHDSVRDNPDLPYRLAWEDEDNCVQVKAKYLGRCLVDVYSAIGKPIWDIVPESEDGGFPRAPDAGTYNRPCLQFGDPLDYEPQPIEGYVVLEDEHEWKNGWDSRQESLYVDGRLIASRKY